MKPTIIPLVVLFLAASAHAQTVETFAGTGAKGFSGDGGPANKAQLDNPFGIGRGPDGALYICDMGNSRIRRVALDGTISTIVGSGKKGYAGDGGPALAASLNSPYEVAWDKNKNLYFVEIGNHVVRRVDAKTGTIGTVAGTGKAGYGGDGGPAAMAQLSQPHSLTIDAADNIFVCDILNHRVRKIDLNTGIITTWAGDGQKKTSPDDSPIAGSSLMGPRALAFAPDGMIWLALREGRKVLRLDPTKGTLRHMAGTGKTGFTGNGGPANDATLAGPLGLNLDAKGNVYLADADSHSIRVINAKTGTLDLLVGTGKRGDGPDGDPLKCQLARPHGVFIDRDGAVFIGDSENHRVRVARP